MSKSKRTRRRTTPTATLRRLRAELAQAKVDLAREFNRGFEIGVIATKRALVAETQKKA